MKRIHEYYNGWTIDEALKEYYMQETYEYMKEWAEVFNGGDFFSMEETPGMANGPFDLIMSESPRVWFDFKNAVICGYRNGLLVILPINKDYSKEFCDCQDGYYEDDEDEDEKTTLERLLDDDSIMKLYCCDDEDYLEECGYKEHHEAWAGGYRCRRETKQRLQPYDGKFGRGWVAESPTRRSTKYYVKTYYVA